MEIKYIIIAVTIIGLIISVYFNINQKSLLSEAEKKISQQKIELNDLEQSLNSSQQMVVQYKSELADCKRGTRINNMEFDFYRFKKESEDRRRRTQEFLNGN